MRFPPLSLNRRQLVQTAAGLVPLALLPRLAYAQRGPGTVLEADPEAHFFLFIQIFGAWDVCLAFDPKNRDDLHVLRFASAQKSSIACLK